MNCNKRLQAAREAAGLRRRGKAHGWQGLYDSGDRQERRLCGCHLPDTGVVICAGSRIPVTHCVRVYGCF